MKSTGSTLMVSFMLGATLGELLAFLYSSVFIIWLFVLSNLSSPKTLDGHEHSLVALLVELPLFVLLGLAVAAIIGIAPAIVLGGLSSLVIGGVEIAAWRYLTPRRAALIGCAVSLLIAVLLQLVLRPWLTPLMDEGVRGPWNVFKPEWFAIPIWIYIIACSVLGWLIYDMRLPEMSSTG